mmetsp:Transcript_27823/g.24615  ORF Transcript_27823/g.24615 Transcript_27823/m.24615 type:complete len:374 (-) Transcript_27823:210-1331(-)
MPKPDEGVLDTLLNAEEVLYAFMALDAICFLVIFIVLCVLLFKLAFRNGKENFDNIVINWDFNEEPIESKLPGKFSFACVISLIVYLAIYGLEFLYFFIFLNVENIPSQLKGTATTIDMIEGWLKDNQGFISSVALIDLCTYLLFIITKFLLFVIFIGRIWHSFKGTHYQSKKCIYKTLIVCIPLVIGLMIFCEFTAYYLDKNADHYGDGILIKTDNGGLMEMAILLGIVIILDGIITFVVIIMYFTKLKSLILQKQRTNRMISGAELEMNDTQRVFVDKAVKHAFLCLVSFGTTQIVWYYSVILFFINTGLWWQVSYFVIIANGLITSTCVFFSYKFNDDCYYKCCAKCHMCLFYNCRKRANKTLASNPVAF